MILEKRIVIDLNDHDSSWLIPFVQRDPDGRVGEYHLLHLLHRISHTDSKRGCCHKLRTRIA